MKSDVDIVCSGGTTMFDRIAERLQKEIKAWHQIQ